MENYFQINLDKKIILEKNYIKSNKVARSLSWSLIGIFVLFNIVFAIYGFGMKDTFLIRDITSSYFEEKNYLLIWTILITTDVIILFLRVVQRLAVYVVLGKNLGHRVNESLSILENVLEYGYQNSVGSQTGDRVIVLIPFDRIRQIKITKAFGMIEITGSISSKYYENYRKRRTRAPKDNYEDGTFVFFDYFDPGLIEYLENNCKEIVEVK